MADHFAMIGFEGAMSSPAKLEAFTEKVLEKCEPVPIDQGAIACLFKDQSGAEVWIGLKKTPNGGTVETINPAFAGSGRVQVEVVADVSDQEYAPFEVRLSARFKGEETPLVFELADPSQAAKLKAGVKATIEIAAFGDPDLFADEAAFARSQKGKVSFAPDAFIPTGLFAEKVGGMATSKGPTAYADFVGKIESAQLHDNAAGGGKFWSVVVRTYANSTIDVLVDKKSMKRDPAPGQILAGRYWLSARLVSVD